VKSFRSGSIGVASAGIAFAMVMLVPLRIQAADASQGSVGFHGKTMQLPHVYLVKGPDPMSTSIRQLVFSPTDIAAKIQACTNLGCVSGELDAGMTVDFDAGPRINYWVVADGQRVQHSGTVKPSAFESVADEPGRLAGRLVFDDSGTGGGKVDVTFDATLVKDFETARPSSDTRPGP
jgi:hypothetical protein